jgi:hypothetical protein
MVRYSTASTKNKQWMSISYGNIYIIAIAYNDNIFTYSTDGIIMDRSIN